MSRQLRLPEWAGSLLALLLRTAVTPLDGTLAEQDFAEALASARLAAVPPRRLGRTAVALRPRLRDAPAVVDVAAPELLRGAAAAVTHDHP